MENNNGIVDVSCFFLVEDSGDSEMDCGLPIKQCQSMDMATAAGGGGEDDAESCSCDKINNERLDDFYEVILQLDDDEDQDIIDCREPAAAAGWSSCSCCCCKMWSIDDGEATGYNISADDNDDDKGEDRKASFDLCREVMDGMEDRLFWETCIAVGYPLN